MYNVEKSTKYYRTNPWKNSYQDRLEVLKKAKKLNKKTVAFVYPIFDSSTFRYRGYNVSETLEYSFQWAGSYFEGKDIKELSLELDHIDILVLIRCDWDAETENLIKLAKEREIPVVYDVDDLIYDPKYMPTVIKTLGLNKYTEWNFWFGLTYRNYLIASKCDAYITTNKYLAEYLEKDFNKPCYIIQNYLNWTQEEVSKYYFEQKQDMKADKPFEIGYFSGSNTHVKDLMIVMPAIERLMNKYDDVVLKIVGYMNLPEEYDHLVDEERIQFIPFQTFVGLQCEQAMVDVNIVPLVNNEFSNCKSELKYFETAIVGTITCATPTYTYKNAINHGDNGYLCEKDEWFEVLEKLYLEGVSPEKQAYIQQRALEVYGNKNQLKHVESVFDDIYDL